MDSGPPTLDLSEYMAQEARFRMVELRSPERYRLLLDAAREAVRQRGALYDQLSNIHLPLPLPASEGSDHG
jgi:pyruvate-ferredoxin/flavodoxin oxidoreductase